MSTCGTANSICGGAKFGRMEKKMVTKATDFSVENGMKMLAEFLVALLKWLTEPGFPLRWAASRGMATFAYNHLEECALAYAELGDIKKACTRVRLEQGDLIERGTCPKCGSMEIGYTYCKGVGECVLASRLAHGETLHSRCPRCSYRWDLAPLDAPPAMNQP